MSPRAGRIVHGAEKQSSGMIIFPYFHTSSWVENAGTAGTKFRGVIRLLNLQLPLDLF